MTSSKTPGGSQAICCRTSARVIVISPSIYTIVSSYHMASRSHESHERVNKLGHRAGRVTHEGGGCQALPGSLRLRQVLERRTAAHPCQQTAQGLADRAFLQPLQPGDIAEGVAIVLPEQERSLPEFGAMACHVVRLAEQVGQPKAKVERWIAEVDDLVIEQDQMVVVDEDVLGAVVSVRQGEARAAGVVDEVVQEARGIGDLACGVAVVRFDTQRLEEGPVVELGRDRVSLMISAPVYSPQ